MTFSEYAVKPIEGKNIYELTKPLSVVFDYKGKTYKTVIQEGFWTDWGSIPRAIQNIYSPIDPEMRECFVFHDFLYEKTGRFIAWHDGKAEMLNLTRKESDDIPLRVLAKKQGAGLFKRNTIYLAVRVGGLGAWNKNLNTPKGERFKATRERMLKEE